MIFKKASIVVALILKVFGCRSTTKETKEVTQDKETAVYEFNYSDNDELNVLVDLKGVPSNINNYNIYYQYDSNTSPHTKGVINKKEINFALKLRGHEEINYFIELYDKNENLCSTKQIFKGVRTNKSGPSTSVSCLKSGSPCKITVDFRNECEEMKDFKSMKCDTSNFAIYYCEKFNEPKESVQQWHQVTKYGNSNIDIGFVTPVIGPRTKFIIKLLKFDNNTKIYSEIKRNDMKFNTSMKFIKFGPNSPYSSYNHKDTIVYSKSEAVNFDCSNYLTNTSNVHVGIIDPSGYNIQTYPNSKLQMNYTESYNNSMLCCIYYVVTNTSTTVEVRRFVKDVSILKCVNKTTRPVLPEGKDENDVPASTYYIIAIVVGTVILLVLISMMIKRICCKKRDSEDTMALQTYTNPNMVLYADLDIRTRESRPAIVKTTEESPYAEIIGVLKPPPG